MRYLIIPGINGSGPDHWQSLWQNDWGTSAARFVPASWDAPDLDDWCRALDRALNRALDRAADRGRPSETVLIAHSLGCLAAAHWLRRRRPDVRGAFLVAPPDVEGLNFPAAEVSGFPSVTAEPLTVPGLVVTSDDDPYCTPEAAGRLAAAWTAGRVSVGMAGHINAASRLGAWPSGRALLAAFIAGLGLEEGGGVSALSQSQGLVSGGDNASA